MTQRLVFMFSGQSSQYYRMGRELYEQHPRFRMWMDHCDEICKPLIGRSLCEIILHDGDRGLAFDRLLYTNPALLSMEFSLARVLMEAGARPDYLLGYSLGEISAAIVGGAVPLEQGLAFVVDYATMMEAHSPPAHMLAVMDVPSIPQRYGALFDGCEVTARNFDRHQVVTGPAAAILRLQEAMVRDHVVNQLLAVNFGFHTAMLDPLREPLVQRAQAIEFQPLRIPMVSCVDGRVYDAGSGTAHWPAHVWSMSRAPIAFDTTVHGLLREGDFRFVDVGPSGTLATFVKYLLPAGSGSTHGDVINAFGRDRLSYGNALRGMGLTDRWIASEQPLGVHA